MNSTPPTLSAAAYLQEGIKQIKAGNLAAAQATLEQAVILEPQNSDAWLWLSGAVTDPADQYYCLQQILQIQPEHSTAKRGLALLAQKHPQLAQPQPVPVAAPAPASQVVQAEPRPAVPAEPVLSVTTSANAVRPRSDPEPARQSLTPSSVPDVSQSAPNSVPTVSAPAPSNDNQAAVQAAIKALGKSASPDEVCRMLSVEHNYSWGEAQRLVAHLQTQYAGTIARKQSPFMFTLSILALISGIGVLVYVLITVLRLGPDHSISLSVYLFRRLHYILGGLGLFVGGIYGIIETSASLFKKDQ